MASESPKNEDAPGFESGEQKLDTFTLWWWFRIFLVCCLLAVGYWVVTASPLVSYVKRLTGGSERAADARKPLAEQLMAADISKVESDPAVLKFAIASGRAAFKENCVSCHGPEGKGNPAVGAPNLTDHDWLWGGTLSAIEQTITHGVRGQDPAGRFGEMPAFLRDTILTQEQVDDVVEYVSQISGQEADAMAAKRGALVYSQNCVNCHGPDGKGDPSVGAPNLTDAIWLYGGDRASLRQTISYARNSVMPPWSGRLPPATIRAVAVYVHNLGGGERDSPR